MRADNEAEAVRAFRALWTKRSLGIWNDQMRRRARRLLHEIRMHRLREEHGMTPDPTRQKLGKRAQRKGNAAENRDLRWFKQAFEAAGYDRNEIQRMVRSRRLDEATDIETGADYEVAWRVYPLLVQRKHKKKLNHSIATIWETLLGALRNKPADVRPVLHLELGTSRHNHKDLCVMRDRDVAGLQGRVSGQMTEGRIWNGKVLHLDVWWDKTVERAVERGRDPRLVLCFRQLRTVLCVFPWLTFQGLYEDLLQSAKRTV